MMNNETMNTVPSELIVAEAREEITALSATDFANPTAKPMFCSLKDDGTAKSKASIFNAINAPDERLSEKIGEVITMKDVIAHEIELIDENTGELIKALRVVIIDDKGKSYEAVSGGVANAIHRILQIFGQPETWTEPIKVKPKQKATRNGNNKVTTLEIV